MLVQIFALVIGSLVDLLTFILLARFALQWARVSFRNPLGRFVMALTDWAVLPMRKLIPGLGGLDLASVFLAWLVQGFYLAIFYSLAGVFVATSPAALGTVALAATFEVLRMGVYLAIGVVLVSALFSWVNPYAPLAPLFDALARPLLQPFRRLIPPIGGVDLSPLALLLLLQVLLTFLGGLQGTLLPRVMH